MCYFTALGGFELVLICCWCDYVDFGCLTAFGCLNVVRWVLVGVVVLWICLFRGGFVGTCWIVFDLFLHIRFLVLGFWCFSSLWV